MRRQRFGIACSFSVLLRIIRRGRTAFFRLHIQVSKHGRQKHKAASQRRLQRKRPPQFVARHVYTEVDFSGEDNNSSEAQGPELCAPPAMSPSPGHSACKDRYAHSVRHVLAHEDVVKLPRVAEEVEPVADKVECRVCEDEDLRLVPDSSEI